MPRNALVSNSGWNYSNYSNDSLRKHTKLLDVPMFQIQSKLPRTTVSRSTYQFGESSSIVRGELQSHFNFDEFW